MASKTVDPWSYKPSSAAAMLFLILFALSTVWHVVIMFRKRVWYFVVLIIGGFRKTPSTLTLLPSSTTRKLTQPCSQ